MNLVGDAVPGRAEVDSTIVWMYLEAFYLIFAAGGLIWLIELVMNRFLRPGRTAGNVSTGILLIMLVALTNIPENAAGLTGPQPR